MKIIIGVVSKAWNKTPASYEGKNEMMELSMNGKEDCSLCGLTNHALDKCFHYDKSKSMEENRKIYATKLEERKKKLEEKKRKEKREAAQSREPSNACLERDAQLFCEP